MRIHVRWINTIVVDGYINSNHTRALTRKKAYCHVGKWKDVNSSQKTNSKYNKHMERCLKALVGRKMCITLAMSCHFILIRLAKKKTNTDCWLRRGKKKKILSNISGGNFLCCKTQTSHKIKHIYILPTLQSYSWESSPQKENHPLIKEIYKRYFL